jgi:hypothetical protein
LGKDYFGVSGKVESEDVSFGKQTDWGQGGSLWRASLGYAC